MKARIWFLLLLTIYIVAGCGGKSNLVTVTNLTQPQVKKTDILHLLEKRCDIPYSEYDYLITSSILNKKGTVKLLKLQKRSYEKKEPEPDPILVFDKGNRLEVYVKLLKETAHFTLPYCGGSVKIDNRFTIGLSPSIEVSSENLQGFPQGIKIRLSPNGEYIYSFPAGWTPEQKLLACMKADEFIRLYLQSKPVIQQAKKVEKKVEEKGAKAESKKKEEKTGSSQILTAQIDNKKTSSGNVKKDRLPFKLQEKNVSLELFKQSKEKQKIGGNNKKPESVSGISELQGIKDTRKKEIQKDYAIYIYDVHTPNVVSCISPLDQKTIKHLLSPQNFVEVVYSDDNQIISAGKHYYFINEKEGKVAVTCVCQNKPETVFSSAKEEGIFLTKDGYILVVKKIVKNK